MLRSSAQYAISHGTTKLFFTLGRLLIISLSSFIGYILITEIEPYRHSIYSPVFLTIIFIIVSYPVATTFLNLFEMAANTILMCYSLELDLLEGANPKCPVGLRNFLKDYMNNSITDDDN